MKICACIAEYNPLHLGHIKHLDYIKNNLKADKIIVVMSGNFTQRGEPAVMNKFKRARQAIIAGADAVIELPTVFATANAEIFAKGAVSIIDGLKIADGICFGVESGEKEQYLSLAAAMNDESKEFKKVLKEKLDSGLSFAKARFEAVKATRGGDFDEQLILSPNNILGLEYTKAILKLNSGINVFPMLRDGNHNDENLKKGITSATSIRSVIRAAQKKKLKKCVPPYVYEDIGDYPFAFDKITMAKVITSTAEEMSQISDCTEGLENRIKALAKDNKSVDGLIEKVCTKRYTASRIRRILISNLLGINKSFIEECLSNKLYARVLAVNSASKDVISALSEKSVIPIITRKSDVSELKKTAAKCYEYDVLANELYNLACDEKTNENLMLTV